MKLFNKSLLLMGLLLLILQPGVKAQIVSRFTFPNNSKTSQKNAPEAAKETALKSSKEKLLIDSLNQHIKELNKVKNPASLFKVQSFLERNKLNGQKGFENLYSNILSASKLSNLEQLKITEIDTSGKDSVKTKTPTPDTNTISANCEKLDLIKTLLTEKQADGSTLVSLIDVKDNPVATFTISEYNKKLFFDQLTKTLKGVCNNPDVDKADSTKIADILSQLDKQEVYDKFLEESLKVKDQNLAGILKIYKKPFVHFLKPIPVKESIDSNKTKAPSDSAKQIAMNTDDEIQNETFSNINFGDDLQTDHIIPEMYATVVQPPLVKEVIENAESEKMDLIDSQIPFTVFEIQMQIQDGFIENIKIFGKLDGDNHILRFENESPIPFSTKREFQSLINYQLREKTIYKNNDDVYINLGDVISFNQNLQLNTKDYSPANQVYNARITDSITEVNLYKEPTSKILEMKVYSDLKGVDNNSPNGLIQIEVSKKLNFWTSRHRSGRRNLYNYGFLNYATPEFAWTKIEDNQKRLVLNYIPNIASTRSSDKPITYTSTINLLKHQVFKVGANLSLALVDIPGWKSVINFGLGLHLGQTAIQDTLRTRGTDSVYRQIATNNVVQYGVNTFQVSPEMSWQLFPDSRYGITFSQKLTSFKMLNESFKQVRDSADYIKYIANATRPDYDKYGKYYLLGTTEIYAFFNVADNNKLFFRYRLNWDWSNSKENYYQIQLGFATYITSTKDGVKKLTGQN